MAHIPGLNYAQTKAKSKAARAAAGRQCQVLEVSRSRCVVSVTVRGTSQRAVLPLDRLYSDQGPCGHRQPPLLGEKLLCDMSPVENKTVNAQWLVTFAWRGKLDSAPKAGPLPAVTGMVAEVGSDSGVLLFVTPTGCRERCAFGRSAVRPGGAPLPPAEPLSGHLQAGEAVCFDCRPTTAAANCSWLADKVWLPGGSEDSLSGSEEEYGRGGGGGGGGGGFILRETLKAVVGRVELVCNYKAVLTFEHAGQRQRALLVTSKYSFPEKATAVERRDLTKVLSRGDQVRFTCHEYDKPDGSDRCGWWVMEAARLEAPSTGVGREAGYFQSGHLYEKIGTVKEALPAEGLLQFVLDGRRQVAWFSTGELFLNGRPCSSPLCDALEPGQRVHFNAEPSPAPRGADWRCTCVWRGEMPTVEESQRRVQAAVTRKQKKAKAGKASIDDLDDFELAAGAAAGDGWAVPAVTVCVPQTAPLLGGRPQHQGGGDRAPRPARPPPLRASMVDELDAVDAGRGGANGGLGGVDSGLEWTLDDGGGGGGGWADELDVADGPALGPGSASSGPSRPLSEASPEHQPEPAGSPGRPPPLLPDRSPPRRSPLLPAPADQRRHSPLLPTPDQAARPPPLTAPEQPPRPVLQPTAAPPPRPPPGLASGEVLAAAAAAAYSRQQQQQQQRARGAGLLPTPPLAGLYAGFHPLYWQPGLLPAYPLPPLAVDPESLRRLAAGGRPPPPPPAPARRVPAADWEAAAAAFRADPAPAAQTESSPTLESLGRRPGEADPLAARLEPHEAVRRGPGSQDSAGEDLKSQENLGHQENAGEGLEPDQASGESMGPQESAGEGPSSQDSAGEGPSSQDSAGEGPSSQDSAGDGPSSQDSAGDVPSSQDSGDCLDEELDRLEADRPPTPPPPVEPVSGRGQILAFVDESRGLAGWERDGRLQHVMFDRRVCYWFGEIMDGNLDLTDCYTPGAEVLFECVPAAAEEPYQWVATRFQQAED